MASGPCAVQVLPTGALRRLVRWEGCTDPPPGRVLPGSSAHCQGSALPSLPPASPPLMQEAAPALQESKAAFSFPHATKANFKHISLLPAP